MNKNTNEKNFKKFFCKMSGKEEDIIMIGLIKIRTRTLPSLRNKPKAKLRWIKIPEILCFCGRDIAFTWYQTLVILQIIDGCQAQGFPQCFVISIFCLTISSKNCLRMLKLPNKNYTNLYSTGCFHTYCRSFWPQPFMENLNLLHPKFAYFYQKISFLNPL